MASSSRSSLVSGPTSLSLFKLSFCTTAGLRSNLVWTHLPQRDNLFAVFDYVTQRSVEGLITRKRSLKLIRGGEVLEHIELDVLALQARLDEERNRSQLFEDADRYVILLVKRPLLAMRYQLPDGQIRRFQLNFLPESGYDVAISALQGLGLPIRDKNRPPTHPVLNNQRSSQLHQHALPSPQLPRLLPSPDFAYRPSTSNGLEYRPSSSAPEPVVERPWTAPDPVSFSQMLPPRRELPPEMRPYTNPSMAAASSTTNLAGNSRSRQEQTSEEPQARKSRQTKSAKPKAPRKKAVPKVQSTRADEGDTVHPPSSQSRETQSPPNLTPAALPKPAAPAKTHIARAPETHSDTLLSPSLDSLANDAQPPLLANSRSIGPVERTIRQGLNITTTSKIPTEIATDKATAPEAITSTLAASEMSGNPLVLRLSRKAMSEVAGNISKPHPEPHTPSTTADEAPSKSTSPHFTEEISASEFMSSLDGFIRDYQHLPAPQPQPTAAEELAAYAAQPDDVRAAVIKDLIFEFLGDENFITLAEDVEKEWRRIGLGF